jgi:hypothetical protein
MTTPATKQLSVAMAPTKQRRHGHDRGEVLVDLAVALADVTLILGVSLAIVDVLSAKPREWRVSEWARARWLTS